MHKQVSPFQMSFTQSLLHSIYNSDSLHKNWPIDFNKEFCSGKVFFRSFSGANSRQLDHNINPFHAEDQPGVFLLHFGTNDMLNNANDTELANNITNIGLSCKGHGVNKVFISSILVWQNPNLYSIIWRVNDQLGELC